MRNCRGNALKKEKSNVIRNTHRRSAFNLIHTVSTGSSGCWMAEQIDIGGCGHFETDVFPVSVSFFEDLKVARPVILLEFKRFPA